MRQCHGSCAIELARKDAGIAQLFGQALVIYREIEGALAAYEQIHYSSLVLRSYLCARLLETLD